MDFSAAHSEFVIASYALSLLCIAAVAIWILRGDGRAKRALQKQDKTKVQD
jgi:heme exporter protein CcmD